MHPFRSLSTKTVFFAALASLLVIIVTLGIRVQREGARHLRDALVLSHADETSRNLSEALFEIAIARARCAIFLRTDAPAPKEDAAFLRERLDRVKERLHGYLSGAVEDPKGIAVLWKSIEVMTPQLEVQLVLSVDERELLFAESWFRNVDLLAERIEQELDRFAFLPGDETGRYVPLALLRVTAARFRNDTSRVASLMGRLIVDRRPTAPREKDVVIRTREMEDRLFRNMRYLAARCAIDGLDGELDEIDKFYLQGHRRLQDSIMESPLVVGLSEEAYVMQTMFSLGAIRRVVANVDAVAASHVRSLVEKEREALLMAHAMLVSLFVLAVAISVLLLRRVATPMRLFAATIDRFRLRRLDEPIPPYPIRDEFGMLLGELEQFRLALREREVLLRSVQEQEQWIRLITDSIPARVSYIDRNLRFGYVNRTFEEHFRVSAEDALGRTVREVLGEKIAETRTPWHECVLLGEDVRFEERNETDASESYSDIIFVPRHDESGAVIGFFSLALDITVRKRLEARLREMADIDDLTGTLNRRAFAERANVEIERSRRTGKAFAFLIMDIDFFKRVNDTFGHSAGDDVLRVLAHICKRETRPYDILGRFGGEEFVILIPDTGAGGVRSLAERLRLSVESTPVASVAGEISFTISVGCTVSLQDDTLDDLLRRADSALYECKNTGRNKVCCA